MSGPGMAPPTVAAHTGTVTVAPTVRIPASLQHSRPASAPDSPSLACTMTLGEYEIELLSAKRAQSVPNATVTG